MISVEAVSKKFGDRLVIDNIDLKISQGEIVGLLGPNGAGKTTTLRMMAGVLPPSSGKILIDGVDIHHDGFAAKRRIGFLPENNPLFEEMTVNELLHFWANIKGIAKTDEQESLDFVIDHCGIAEVYYRPVAELSKGFRQRVGLSQAILTKPDILILDEPTEGLDPNQRADIANLITTLGRSRTVIISSHVLGEIAKISSRLIVIHKGKIVADETPENLKKSGGRSGSRLTVEIRGAKVAGLLDKIEGVAGVKQLKDDVFEITCKPKYDIRESVFKTAVERKWILLGMTQKEKDIEDVFAALTQN